MAGSGKTSLVHRLTKHLEETKTENYIINIDPAVRSLPYEPNIDIRDTVRPMLERHCTRAVQAVPHAALVHHCLMPRGPLHTEGRPVMLRSTTRTS